MADGIDITFTDEPSRISDSRFGAPTVPKDAASESLEEDELESAFLNATSAVEGGDAAEDDEFGYAFSDKPREGPEAAKPKFQAEPLPAHLVSTVGKQPLASFTEEDEEQDEDEAAAPTPPIFQAVLHTNNALAGTETRSGNGAATQVTAASNSLHQASSPYDDSHEGVGDASLVLWASGTAANTPGDATERSSGEHSGTASSSPPRSGGASPSGGQFNVSFSKWGDKPGGGARSAETTPPNNKPPAAFVLPASAMSFVTTGTTSKPPLAVAVSPRADGKSGTSTPETESPSGAATRFSVSGWVRPIMLDSPSDANSHVSVSSLAGWGRGGIMDSPGDATSRYSVNSLAAWNRGAPDSPAEHHPPWLGRGAAGGESPHEAARPSTGHRFSNASVEGAAVVAETVPEGEDDGNGARDDAGGSTRDAGDVDLEWPHLSVNNLATPGRASPAMGLGMAPLSRAGRASREGDEQVPEMDSVTFPTGAGMHGSLTEWLPSAKMGGRATVAGLPAKVGNDPSLSPPSRLEGQAPQGPAAPPRPAAESPPETVKELQAQWDAVTAQHAVEPVNPGPPRNQGAAQKQLSYQEVETFFMKADIGPYLRTIQEEPVQGFVSKCLCSMFGPPALKERLLDKRKHIFAAAQMKFDDKEPFHVRLLQNIFALLVGKIAPGQVPRTGSHWAQIGFQGNDPSTDLRGGGMLGLIQLLFLIAHNPSNAQIIFQLSRNKEQEFPFAPLSINLTKFAIEVLRSGKLNRDANQLGDIFLATNLFYAGSFYEYYQRWKAGRYTMRESGTVIKEVELYIKEFPRKMINKASTVLGAI